MPPPILQKKKLGLREAKKLPQGHTEGKSGAERELCCVVPKQPECVSPQHPARRPAAPEGRGSMVGNVLNLRSQEPPAGCTPLCGLSPGMAAEAQPGTVAKKTRAGSDFLSHWPACCRPMILKEPPWVFSQGRCLEDTTLDFQRKDIAPKGEVK